MKQGIWRRYKDLCDEQILPVDKVRYIGEPVAAVAAVTEEIAEKALELIEVDYEVLPAVFEPLDAIKKGAPEIHEGFERNINVTRHIEWGEVDEGFEEAEEDDGKGGKKGYIREDWFRCGGQAHMCMETRCAVSSYTPDKKLTIYHSNQSPLLYAGPHGGRPRHEGGRHQGHRPLHGRRLRRQVRAGRRDFLQRHPLYEVLQAGKDRLHEGRRLHRHQAADPDVLLHADGRQEGRHVPGAGRQKFSRTAAPTRAWAQRPST